MEYIAFDHHRCVTHGSKESVALKLHALESSHPILVFEYDTGRQVDFDLSGSADDVRERYAGDISLDEPHEPPRRGRPKLGVKGREVTLLPRHWEWLDNQRGGASAALRRLVDEARKAHSSKDLMKKAQDRTNRFLFAIAGDLPNFEDCTRALFSGDGQAFALLTEDWPKDVKKYAHDFAQDAFKEKGR